MTNSERKPVRALITLYDKDLIVKQIVYEYEDGTRSDKLKRDVHEGMFTDTILFGDNLNIRFYLYFNAIELYHYDVTELVFTSERNEYCNIRCFGQYYTLMPGQTVTMKKGEKPSVFEDIRTGLEQAIEMERNHDEDN